MFWHKRNAGRQVLRHAFPMVICLAVLAANICHAAPSAKAADADVRGSQDLSLTRPWLPRLMPLTDDQRKVLAAFDARFRVPDVHPNGRGVDAATMAGLRKTIREDYGIHVERGRLVGKPIEYREADGGNHVPSDGIKMLDVMGTINRLADAYADATPGQVEELKSLFLDVCRHILDQGLTEGAPIARSPFGIPSSMYGWFGQSAGIFKLRQVLDEAGLLLPMSRAVAYWQNRSWLNEVPDPNNSDEWRCGYWHDLMVAIAAMPDTPEKWQRLSAALRYISLNITTGDAFSQALPPSGEFNHHGGFHLAYSYAMEKALDVVGRLHQSGLDVSAEAHERLRAYGRTTAWLVLDGTVATNLLLRSGGPEGKKSVADELRALADLGPSNASGTIDPEMAALYLAVIKNDSDGAMDKDAQRYRRAGISAAELSGAMAMPNRPALVWRTPGTLVSAAAMRPDFRGFEMYAWTQSNIQGRYSVYGSVMALQAGRKPAAAGYLPEQGWNWSLWPGATTFLADDVELTPRSNLGYGGNRSAVGGVNVLSKQTSLLDNVAVGSDAAGLFMVDFDSDGVHFRKSVFAVGGHVLVQTSDIGSTRHEPIVTTLYQDHLDDARQASMLEGETLTNANTERSIRVDKPLALRDAEGMDYTVLPVPGQPVPPTLRVLRRHQTWRLPYDRFLKDGFAKGLGKKGPLPENLSTQNYLDQFVPQVGDFALAYIDHGTAPRDAADAYLLTLPSSTAQDPSNTPRLLAQTKAGHAAFDPVTRTYAYAGFEPDTKWNQGPLLGLGRPASVLLREMPDGSLKLSVASWSVKDNAPFILVLKGNWKTSTSGGRAVAKNGETELSIPYASDLPQSLVLRN